MGSGAGIGSILWQFAKTFGFFVLLFLVVEISHAYYKNPRAAWQGTKEVFSGILSSIWYGAVVWLSIWVLYKIAVEIVAEGVRKAHGE